MKVDDDEMYARIEIMISIVADKDNDGYE